MTMDMEPAARRDEEIRETGTEGFVPVAEDEAPAVLEALLFASGDPVDTARLSAVTGLSQVVLVRILEDMANRMASDRRRGLRLRREEDRWYLSTRPDLSSPLARLFHPKNRPPLSQAAYETLAIIAYNQPVTRSQIESVRGVASDSVLPRLLERDLIRECGTLDAPGRPILFETTDTFLREFGLSSTRDLPPMEMMMYGTLRDLQANLEIVSEGSDRQMTLDQIPSANRPEAGSDMPDSPRDRPPRTDGEDDPILRLSSAFFGDETESSP